MNTISELSVDTSRGEMMDINVCASYSQWICPMADTPECLHTTVRCLLQFDVTFHKLPCAWTSLDAMDISGEMHLDVVSAYP